MVLLLAFTTVLYILYIVQICVLFIKVSVLYIKFAGNTTLLRYDKTWKKLLDIYDSYGCIKYGTGISMATCN